MQVDGEREKFVRPPDLLRALTLHTVVPAGHVAVPVLTTAWLPHLKPGEFAVLDAADVERQVLASMPSTRAAVILSAAGIPLTGGRDG